MDSHFLFITLVTLLSLSCLSEVEPAYFKFVNKCRRTIWPGLLSGASTAQLSNTGFALKSGKSRSVYVPKSWSGRVWGRSFCAEDSSGKFSCLTGDCGSGKVECAGSGAKPPATLAEFTLNGAGGLDFYDVSLVDGYNLPMLIFPKKFTKGGCAATGCLIDLNGACPRELKLSARVNGERGVGVACRSACDAFGDPKFCCSEAYNMPETCSPSVYSLFFKNVCPRAYSYAYDDKTSTYTCAGADYTIVFCPPPYSSKYTCGINFDKQAMIVTQNYPLEFNVVTKPAVAWWAKRWGTAATSKQDHDVSIKPTSKWRFVIRSDSSAICFQADSSAKFQLKSMAALLLILFVFALG